MIEMIELTEILMTQSTAEDEANLFAGVFSSSTQELHPVDSLPPGQYRVIDGQLYRIASGMPALP